MSWSTKRGGRGERSEIRLGLVMLDKVRLDKVMLYKVRLDKVG